LVPRLLPIEKCCLCAKHVSWLSRCFRPVEVEIPERFRLQADAALNEFWVRREEGIEIRLERRGKKYCCPGVSPVRL
jgi:hypothetical protein